MEMGNQIALVSGLLAHAFLFSMMLVSSKITGAQFWPPPSKKSWKYHTLWWSIRWIVVCILWLIFSDNSSINLPEWLRFYVALPIFIVSFLAGTVAAFQLGWRNTHGEAASFIDTGLYKYSRNPQYVFYSISFVFLGLWVASNSALMLLIPLACWYLFAPFAEERWLERHYGEIYIRYKRRTPRYLGITRDLSP